jgi:hypothetical protein
MRCTICHESYSNKKSHQALCARQEVKCSYPALQPGEPEIVVLPRVNGVFQCLRCKKQLKKDQNMKTHASQCRDFPDVQTANLDLVPASPPMFPVGSVNPPELISSPVLLTSTINHQNYQDSDLELTLAPAARPPHMPLGAPSGVISELSPPNIYESLIRADKHSVSDSFLLCTPYVVNTAHMVLICTHCKHAINPRSASTHITQVHRRCKPPKDLVKQLNDKYPGLVYERLHPLELIEPIFGLAVPMDEYAVCVKCRQAYANKESWRRHVCPNSHDLGEHSYFLSLVQTFFRGPKICYFPVKTPTPQGNVAVVDDFTLYKSQSIAVDVPRDEVVEREDYRELDQFLSKEGWISHISGCVRSDLIHLVSVPQCNEDLAQVMPNVLVLMTNIQSIIGGAGFHVRRLLGRRPS